MVVIDVILNLYWTAHQEWYFKDVLREHGEAIMMLPEAAGIAVAIVVFLRQTDGPIEFEGLGFKLKGAAGQVFMWILTFLAIVGGVETPLVIPASHEHSRKRLIGSSAAVDAA
ncbi:MAG: hypothetical protein ACREDT_15975 [Methylocella sp.]